MPRLSLATRLELWSALPCEAGAARLADVPDADVLTIATPEAVQRLEAVTVTLTSRTPAAALVAPRGALAFVDLAPDGVTVAGFDVYRVLSVKRTSGRARGVVTVQAVPPLVDWADVGIMRETTSAGLVRFDFGGIYTPAEALAPALAWLTANGYAHWALDPALADYDARPLEIERKTPLEVVRLVESTWGLEAVVVSVGALGAGGYVLGMRAAVAAADAPPPLPLEVGGALESLEVTTDASDLATVVLPLGAGGATIARAAWRVAAVDASGGWLDLVDEALGPGPVQLDGQLVGAYVQREDGARSAVLETTRAGGALDGRTSRVRVAPAFAAGVGVGEWAQFRADAAGAQLVELTHPTAALAPPLGFGRVVRTVERAEFPGAWNLTRNPRGDVYTSPTAPPAGWRLYRHPDAPGAVLSSVARVTDAPVGMPLGDELASWRVTLAAPAGVEALELPLTPAIDPVAGDETLSGYVVLYADADLAVDLSTTRPASRGYTRCVAVSLACEGVVPEGLTLPTARSWTGRTWLVLGFKGLRLVDLRRFRLRVTGENGAEVYAGGATGDARPAGAYVDAITPADPLTVYVAFAQLTRTPGNVSPALGAQACAIWQVGNAYLADHGAPPQSIEAAVVDRARLDPARYGDVPLVLGTDRRLVAADVGLDTPARIVGRTPNRKVPGDTQVVFATPAQRETATEFVLAELRRRLAALAGFVLHDEADPGTGLPNDNTAPGTPTTPGTGGGGGTPGLGAGGLRSYSRPILADAAGKRTALQRLDGTAYGAAAEEFDAGLAFFADCLDVARVGVQGVVDPSALGPAGSAIVIAGVDGGTPYALDGAASLAEAAAPVLTLSAGGLRAGTLATLPASLRRVVALNAFVRGGDGTTRPLVGNVAVDFYAGALPDQPNPPAVADEPPDDPPGTPGALPDVPVCALESFAATPASDTDLETWAAAGGANESRYAGDPSANQLTADGIKMLGGVLSYDDFVEHDFWQPDGLPVPTSVLLRVVVNGQWAARSSKFRVSLGGVFGSNGARLEGNVWNHAAASGGVEKARVWFKHTLRNPAFGNRQTTPGPLIADVLNGGDYAFVYAVRDLGNPDADGWHDVRMTVQGGPVGGALTTWLDLTGKMEPVESQNPRAFALDYCQAPRVHAGAYNAAYGYPVAYGTGPSELAGGVGDYLTTRQVVLAVDACLAAFPTPATPPTPPAPLALPGVSVLYEQALEFLPGALAGSVGEVTGAYGRRYAIVNNASGNVACLAHECTLGPQSGSGTGQASDAMATAGAEFDDVAEFPASAYRLEFTSHAFAHSNYDNVSAGGPSVLTAIAGVDRWQYTPGSPGFAPSGPEGARYWAATFELLGECVRDGAGFPVLPAVWLDRGPVDFSDPVVRRYGTPEGYP